MRRTEPKTTAAAVAAACCWALKVYLGDPWRWPRESDLVVDLVTRLREELGARHQPKLTQACLCISRRYALTRDAAVQIPRVRTEVRLTSGGGDRNNNVRDRTDIGILRANQLTTLYFHGNGVRDVTLLVNAGDIDALIEVKLSPHLYLRQRGGHPASTWVDDLIKLHCIRRRFPSIRTSALVWIDTSLPVDVVGLGYSPGRWASARRAERSPNSKKPDVVKSWPLYARDLSIRSYAPKEYKGKVDINLSYQQNAPDGLVLWALGVTKGVDSSRILPSGHCEAETLCADDVKGCCWSVVVDGAK